jgi:hypothetical protein
LATAREKLAGAGTQSAGLSFGGYDTAALAVTEEYTIVSASQLNIGDSWKTLA